MRTDRGDVVLVMFPDSNLLTAKRRPAIVVRSDRAASGLAQTIVAMVTSNLTRRGPASRVFIGIDQPAATGTGLKTDSVIMADNLTTVLDTEIARVIGRIADMQPVDAALRFTLNL